MPVFRQKPPAEHETDEIYAVRLHKVLLKGIPETTREIPILGDRYDGLFGHTGENGDSVSLNGFSGCHQLCIRCSTVYSLLKTSNIGNCTEIAANSKSKANWMKAIYETWEANGFDYINS